jgi:hypothetical protein
MVTLLRPRVFNLKQQLIQNAVPQVGRNVRWSVFPFYKYVLHQTKENPRTRTQGPRES